MIIKNVCWYLFWTKTKSVFLKISSSKKRSPFGSLWSLDFPPNYLVVVSSIIQIRIKWTHVPKAGFFFSFLRSAKDIFIEWCVCGCDSKTYGLYHEILWWWLWWVHNYKLKIGISIGESVCLHLFNHIYRERENEELEKLVAKKKTQMSVLVLVFVLIWFRSSSSWLDVSRFF